MPSAPDINADAQARRKLDEERVAFLRQCAIGSAHAGVMLGDDVREVATRLVAGWSVLFDAIEATRGK